MVQDAIEGEEAIVLEDLTGLNDKTHREDGKSKDYHFKTKNSFPLWKAVLHGEVQG